MKKSHNMKKCSKDDKAQYKKILCKLKKSIIFSDDKGNKSCFRDGSILWDYIRYVSEYIHTNTEIDVIVEGFFQYYKEFLDNSKILLHLYK